MRSSMPMLLEGMSACSIVADLLSALIFFQHLLQMLNVSTIFCDCMQIKLCSSYVRMMCFVGSVIYVLSSPLCHGG